MCRSDRRSPLALRVVLIGLSGAGKTTVAPLVAARLGLDSIDLDAEVERSAEFSVSELFRERGEDAFRAMEADALRSALEGPSPGLVIACGGGVLRQAENRTRLRAKAFVVWLRVRPARAAERLGAAGVAQRPLLAGPSPESTLEIVLRDRVAAYEAAADAAVDTDDRTPEEVADQVTTLCRSDPAWP